jgi:hypothetical protein
MPLRRGGNAAASRMRSSLWLSRPSWSGIGGSTLRVRLGMSRISSVRAVQPSMGSPGCRAPAQWPHAVAALHWVLMWPYPWQLKHCFTRHCRSYRSHWKNSLCQIRPSSMILLASFGLVNSMVIVDAILADVSLVSQSMCLVSARGINGLFSCRIRALFSSNLLTSIVLVRIPCARTPYVGICTVVPLQMR